MCHLSPFGLLNIAQAGILSLGILDVITREYHHVPPSGTLRAPLLKPETAHRKRHALGRQRTLHVHADKFDDARGREELARLVIVGLAQVGEDELFLDVGLLKLPVVLLQLSVLLIVKPVAEALLPQGISLCI